MKGNLHWMFLLGHLNFTKSKFYCESSPNYWSRDTVYKSFGAYVVLFEIPINQNNIGRYFAVPYFLPKLDMVAIPDFAFGAMENYGLVTCCETALLFDNQHSATAHEQRVIWMLWILLFLLEFCLANIVWSYCFNNTRQNVLLLFFSSLRLS